MLSRNTVCVTALFVLFAFCNNVIGKFLAPSGARKSLRRSSMGGTVQEGLLGVLRERG